jgi:hypothetical protein
VLEKGHRDYNLVGVWCGEVLIRGQPPLKDSTRSEEMVVNKLGDLAFVESLRPKHVRIRGGHGGRMKVSD